MPAFDSIASSPFGSGDLTWVHTPLAPLRGLFVGVVSSAADPTGVTGVTVGGVAMEEVPPSPNVKPTGEPSTVRAYFLGADIPAGPQQIVVRTTTVAARYAVSIGVTAGANDTAVLLADGSINTDAIDSPSVALALGEAQTFLLEVFHSGVQRPTFIWPLAGWTGRIEWQFGVSCGACYTYDGIATGDVQAGWGQSLDDAVALILAIKEVPVAPPPPLTKRRVSPYVRETIYADTGYDVDPEAEEGIF